MPVLTASEFENLPRGAYNSILTKIEEKVSGAGDVYLAWTFEVLDGVYVGKKIRANSSTNLGPKTKTRAWVESLLNRQLAKGEQLDTDDLINLRCSLVVSTKDKDGSTFNEIDAILPINE